MPHSEPGSPEAAPVAAANIDVYPPGAPASDLFSIQQTPHAGRAVFAKTFIPADTLVWRSDDLTLSVLLREYRREVCARCFGYEYGRDLSVRDAKVGFAFCNQECQARWREANGQVGIETWTVVEKLVKGRSKEDADMVDLGLPRPKRKEIEQAWEHVAAQASQIRIARRGGGPPNENGEIVQVTKQHKKAVQKALQQPISPDVMAFCVSGILWRYRKPEEWENVLALAADSTPYHNTDDLQAFTRTYLHMLAVVPLELLDLVTPENLFLLSARDSHNSFGIRSLEDDGSEFFGYGCWPAASYFNHSCGPNIEKQRIGRVWEFRAACDIEEGEELNITYLSGEERKLSRGKRLMTLKRNWGFDCGCDRCEL